MNDDQKQVQVVSSTNFTGDLEVPQADLSEDEEFFPIHLNTVLFDARNTIAEAQSAEDFYDTLTDNINTITEYVATTVAQVQTTSEEVVEATKSHLLSASIASTAKEKSNLVYAAVKDAILTTKESINQAVIAAEHAGHDAKDKIQQNVQNAEVAAKERVNQIATDVKENVEAAAAYTQEKATIVASTVKDKINDKKK